MTKWLSGVLFLIGLCYLAWRSSSECCSQSFDGEHEFVHERDERGWFVRCLACGHRSKGIEAFARSAS